MQHRFAWALCVGLACIGCKQKETASASPQTEPGSPGDEPVASPPSSEQPPTEPPSGGQEPPIVVSDAPCETDADCVPAQCCHAAACTNTAQAPSCDEVECTEECRFGTLDCGGACSCQEGKCAARLSVAPETP